MFLDRRPYNICEQLIVFCMTRTSMSVANLIYWKMLLVPHTYRYSSEFLRPSNLLIIYNIIDDIHYYTQDSDIRNI